MHGGRKRGDGDVARWHSGHVIAWHAQLQSLGVEQARRHVLELQGGQRGKLLVDSLKHVVV